MNRTPLTRDNRCAVYDKISILCTVCQNINDYAMSSRPALSRELIQQALVYHGRPLQKIWETERRQNELLALGIDANLDYSVYMARQKHFTLQDRAKRLKLQQFMARKANVLYGADTQHSAREPEIDYRQSKFPETSKATDKKVAEGSNIAGRMVGKQTLTSHTKRFFTLTCCAGLTTIIGNHFAIPPMDTFLDTEADGSTAHLLEVLTIWSATCRARRVPFPVRI